MNKTLFLLLFVALFVSCTKGDVERNVGSVIDLREKAFREKNLGEYMRLFSKDYRDKKGGFSELKARMKKNFEVLNSIDITHRNRDISLSGDTAKVVQEFTLKFTVNKKTQLINGQEIFKLKKTGENWLISGRS